MVSWAGPGPQLLTIPFGELAACGQNCVVYVHVYVAYTIQLCATGSGVPQGNVSSCSCLWLHAMLQRPGRPRAVQVLRPRAL